MHNIDMFGRYKIGRRRSGGFVNRHIGLWSLACLLLIAPDARAAPAAGSFAVVVGEANYGTLPGAPACIVSAQTIAARLRALGFDVVARTDASNGEVGAMLIDLARRTASTAHPTVVIYFCGHATELDGRAFLLPVDAVLNHPSDVLAEGVPAQSVVDIADHGTRAGLTVFDVYAQPPARPNAPAALPTMLAGQALSPGHIVVAASETAAAATATPLAQSLSASLTKPPVDLDAMLATLRKDLAESDVALAGSGNGDGTTLVAAAAPPAAPPKPATPKPAATPASPSPAVQAAEPATPAVSLPDESQYSVLDRRRVQAALRLLGYYAGTVDGIFGPQTRAAIRHYQHDTDVPETGTLTPDEATRLIAGLPLTSQ
jgi:hypothetical protein